MQIVNKSIFIISYNRLLVKGIFDLPYNIPNIIDIIEKNN